MIDCASALLAWMSHLGQGSENQFVRASDALRLDLPSDQQQQLRGVTWRRLIELGHVCQTQNNEWRVEPPTLSLLPSGTAAWRGGRVQVWTRQMEECARHLQCSILSDAIYCAPPRFHISGDLAALKTLAEMTGASLEDNVPLRLLAALPLLAERLQVADVSLPPSDAASERFDYDTMAWAASDRPSTARRYRFSNQRDAYFVEIDVDRHIRVSQAEAVHFGAALEGRRLCHYDEATERLTVAWQLPLELSRPLCLCRGLPPEIDKNHRTYPGVPKSVSILLFRAISDDQGKVRWF